MDSETYDVEAGVESGPWWFTGRRRLFAAMLCEHGISPDARVLDVGTSSGTDMRMLRDMGFRSLEGLDSSDKAIRWFAMKGLGKGNMGDICSMPFGDSTFDLVLATDVIEHVDDE